MIPKTRLTQVCAGFGLLISGNALALEPAPIILIEARIIEAGQIDLDDFGVEWSSPSSSDTLEAPPGADFHPLLTPGWLLAGVVNDPEFEGILRALNQRDGTDILSSPSILTPSGQRAGIEIPFGLPATIADPPEVVTLPPRFQDTGLRLDFTPVIGPGDVITLEVEGGSFFRPDEVVFDIFAGSARGNMSYTDTITNQVQETIVTQQVQTRDQVVGFEPFFNGVSWVDVPIIEQRQVVTEQRETVTRIETREITRGAFENQAGIYGVRGACFFGNHFGVGALGQYIDGDLRGAWAGEIQGIARLPIEFPTFAIAPYLVTGAGAFLSENNYATFSLGGGFEFRINSNGGFFTEARQTWTNESDLDFTSVIGGIRIITDGTGPRKGRTRVRVRDGQTAVIGGLIGDGVAEKKGRVPLLSNIPVLGRLFRNRRDSLYHEELILFVTPRVMVTDEEDR